MVTSRTGTGQWKRVVKERRRIDQERGLTHCPRCRVRLNWDEGRQPNSAETDHIIPHALGGPDTLSNSQTLCRLCNQQLGNKRRKGRPRPAIANPVTTVDW